MRNILIIGLVWGYLFSSLVGFDLGVETELFIEDLSDRHVVERSLMDFDNYVIKQGEMMMETTAYTAECEGCIGITRAGLDVRETIDHRGYCIIATDPDVIPLGSLVEIEGEVCLAADTGGAIKGNRIDRLMRTKDEAFTYGRRYEVPVRVVGEMEIKREDN